MQINHKIYGNNNSISLVFFHGWGFNHLIWLPLIPKLQSTYKLILIDLPGFGHTSIMGWQDFKENLLKILPPKFIAIGWSMGGLYATRLAIEEPIRVSYLINISTSPRFIVDNSWPGMTKKIFANFYQKLSQDIDNTLKEFVKLQTNRKHISFEQGVTPSKEGLILGLDILNTWDLRIGIKNLKQPTCYMFGRLDSIVPIVIMDKMQLLYPSFKYIFFSKDGHIPFLSNTELFIQELLTFITI